MYFSEQAMNKVIELSQSSKPCSLLDIGCGKGEHAKRFLQAGIHVTAVDIVKPPIKHKNFKYIDRFFEKAQFDRKWDFVWASHILEHTLNPHDFLQKAISVLKEDGYIAITVPPLKHQIVGGHVNLFNGGLLLYRLILAGIDCRDAMVKKYGYNVSIVAKNKPIDPKVRKKLKYDNGDIETLSKYFPDGFNFQGFDGNITSVNWA